MKYRVEVFDTEHTITIKETESIEEAMAIVDFLRVIVDIDNIDFERIH